MQGAHSGTMEGERDGAGIFAHQFGVAEVYDPDAAMGVEAEILGLDVAVEDASPLPSGVPDCATGRGVDRLGRRWEAAICHWGKKPCGARNRSAGGTPWC
jgi:hypothetical protein